MPTLQVNLEDKIRDFLQLRYQELGYPLGKSIKGLKKWSKRELIRYLIQHANAITNKNS
mgnify:CR=1 FL=1